MDEITITFKKPDAVEIKCSKFGEIPDAFQITEIIEDRIQLTNILTDSSPNNNLGNVTLWFRNRPRSAVFKKKKLPKTKEELVFLLQDAIIQKPCGFDLTLSRWIESFLSDYED